MPPRLYCGNNANNSDVVNGIAVIGTRRGCLEKGKYIGNAQAPDPSFLRPYVPIDDTKVYCGNYDNKPAGYDRFGGLYECFLKGIGVGKRTKAVAILGGGGAPPAPPAPPAHPAHPGPHGGGGGAGGGTSMRLRGGGDEFCCGDIFSSNSSQSSQSPQSPQSSQSSQPSEKPSHERELAKNIIKWVLFIFVCVSLYMSKPFFLDDPNVDDTKCDEKSTLAPQDSTQPRSLARYVAIYSLLFLLFLAIDV